MKTLIILVSLGFVISPVFFSAAEVQACSCLPPDLVASYNSADEVIEVTIIKKKRRSRATRGRRGQRPGREWAYSARVHKVYKGCRRVGSIVRISTPRSGAQCGVSWLKRGERYLLGGETAQRGRLDIAACGYNVETSNLSEKERRFLDTRYNCCGETCACVGSDEAACLVDPCAVATVCDEAVECISNYCGGCRAEFYDSSGLPVCQDEVCSLDADCDAGRWCRPIEGSVESACVAYQPEGEFCGGYTPMWSEERCDPELVCTDFPAYIADVPGRCRESCSGNADCDESRYCSTQPQVCRDDGTCFTDEDCESGGNDFIRPACVGYGVCGSAGQCGWECGDVACRDLAYPVSSGAFGFCRMILGFGVVDGECAAIGGCDGQGQVLHDSLETCEAACEVDYLIPVGE